MAESEYCVARLPSWSTNKCVKKYSYKDTFVDKCVPPSYVRLDSIGEELQNSGGSKMWGNEIKEFCGEICEQNPAFLENLEYSQRQHGAAICEDLRKFVSNACDPFDTVYASTYSSLLDNTIAAEAVDALVVIQPTDFSTEVIDLDINRKSSSNRMATFLQEVVVGFEPGVNKENYIQRCNPVDTLLEKGAVVEPPEIFQELSKLDSNPAPLSDPVITCIMNNTCMSLSKELIDTSASLDSQHKLENFTKDSTETIKATGIVSKPMHSTFFHKKSSSNEDSDDDDEDSDEDDKESDEEDEESENEDEEDKEKDEEENDDDEEEVDSDGWDDDDDRYVDAANLSACQSSYSAVVTICVSESEWSDGIEEEINKVPKKKINKLPKQNENFSINIVSVIKDIFGMDCSSIGDAETANEKKLEEINKNWFHMYSSDDLHPPTSRNQKSVHFIEGDALATVHLLDDDESRKGPWEEIGRDRARFAKRIRDVEAQISNAFQAKHRQKMYLLLSKSPCFHLSSDVRIFPGSSPIL